jgi:hypothetical protein
VRERYRKGTGAENRNQRTEEATETIRRCVAISGVEGFKVKYKTRNGETKEREAARGDMYYTGFGGYIAQCLLGDLGINGINLDRGRASEIVAVHGGCRGGVATVATRSHSRLGARGISTAVFSVIMDRVSYHVHSTCAILHTHRKREVQSKVRGS